MSNLPTQLQKQVSAAENYYLVANKTGSDATIPVDGLEGEVTAEAGGGVVAITSEAKQDNTPAEDENSGTYAQRWRSQQGIIASANQKLEYAEQRIGQLETLITSMQIAPVTQHVEDRKHLTDKDSEEYGEDMVDFVKRAVAEGTESLRGENEALRRQLTNLNGVVPTVQKLTQQHQNTREEAFWGSLDRAVTDWDSINNDQRFRNWLLESDPMTGITRDVYLKDAQRDLDVTRVSSIFNSWKQQSPVESKTSTRNVARNELEMQVTPGSRTGNDAPQSVEEKRWSNTDIAKYYDDLRKGKFKGHEADARAMEEDIFRARSKPA